MSELDAGGVGGGGSTDSSTTQDEEEQDRRRVTRSRSRGEASTMDSTESDAVSEPSPNTSRDSQMGQAPTRGEVESTDSPSPGESQLTQGRDSSTASSSPEQQSQATEQELGFFERAARFSSDTIENSFSDTGFVSQFVEEDQIVENQPFRQEFGGATAKGLARFYTGGSAAETGALAVDAAERASFIATGEDGELTSEDFVGATGFDEGDFAEQFVEEDLGTPASEERTGRAEETTELVGAAAAASAEFYRENPAQIGGILGESVGGLGPGITAGSLAARTVSPNLRTPGSGQVDLSNSRFIADDRATAQIPKMLERDSPTTIEAADLEVDLDDVSSQPPDVDPQAQRQELRDIRRRRQELISEQSARQGGSGGGDYVAPERGGDFVASRRDFRTVSDGPDTTRSGPTQTQREAFSGSRSAGDNPLSLGPGEGIQARNLDTPVTDLREVVDIEPEAMRAPSASLAESGFGGALVSGPAGSAGTGASASILNDISVGEGISGTTQVATFESPTGPSPGRDSVVEEESVPDVQNPTTVSETDAPATSQTATSILGGLQSGLLSSTSTISSPVSDTQPRGLTAPKPDSKTLERTDSVLDQQSGAMTDQSTRSDTQTTPETTAGPTNKADPDSSPVIDTPPKVRAFRGPNSRGQSPGRLRVLDTPTPTPQRLPSFDLDADSGKKKRRRRSFGSFNKTFESDVATADEVLGGDDKADEKLFEDL